MVMSLRANPSAVLLVKFLSKLLSTSDYLWSMFMYIFDIRFYDVHCYVTTNAGLMFWNKLLPLLLSVPESFISTHFLFMFYVKSLGFPTQRSWHNDHRLDTCYQDVTTFSMGECDEGYPHKILIFNYCLCFAMSTNVGPWSEGAWHWLVHAGRMSMLIGQSIYDAISAITGQMACLISSASLDLVHTTTPFLV